MWCQNCHYGSETCRITKGCPQCGNPDPAKITSARPYPEQRAAQEGEKEKRKEKAE